ncbi:threonine aldolase family protein [Acinetobacter baumannii]
MNNITPHSRLIPLSSDTESQPTIEMRQAIANAIVGDEQHGEDPTVNLLQERVAELLGKEAALWFPAGTMCNFVAVKTHTQPADAIIADLMAHIIRAESGGVALSSGVLVEGISTERGIFSADQLNEALSRLNTVGAPYGPSPKLICVEQTHNFGGGTVWSLDELRAVSSIAKNQGIAMHMDGARLLNASIASGVPASQFAGEVDSVWIDFTKGLGAPIGAVLAGNKEFIAQAKRYKHVFGGAMRQAGIAAAGCLYALDHHIARLSEDHDNAKYFAKGLSEISGINLLIDNPETNMVFFDIAETGLSNENFIQQMKEHGVKLGVVRGQIRAVTHIDVSRKDIDLALSTIQKII